MSKLILILVLQSLLSFARPEPGQGPEAVNQWFQNLHNAKEKLTKIHFYFHDTLSGKNPSAVPIARSGLNPPPRNNFGVLYMMDDPLTVGPEAESKVIGRAQGIYGSASLEEVGLLMTLNYVFTDGEFNGSTLSVLAHNPIFHQYREMPIVGGSGVFRLARGVAIAQTVWVSNTTGDAVVEYNVFALHYAT